MKLLLSLAICLLAHVPVYASGQFPIQSNFYESKERPLNCDDFLQNQYWLRHDLNELNDQGKNASETLKIHLFRVSPNESKTVIRGETKYKHVYRDYAFASNLETDQIPESLKREVMGHDYQSKVSDSTSCKIEAESQNLKLLSLATLSKYLVLTSISDFYVSSKEMQSSGTESSSQGESNIAISKTIEMYPWVDNFQLKDVNSIEPILVLEKSECAEKGNFFIVSTGRLLDESKDKLKIVRSNIYAANHYYGESGDPNTRHVVENSIDPTHYWCVPKKEFCYRETEFGKFGLNVKKNLVEEVDSSRVYNLRLGMVSALQLIAVEHCSNYQADLQMGSKR